QLGAELSESLGIAARGSDQARVLMLRSLMAISSAREPLAAGLAVALAEPSAPVSEQPLEPETFNGAEVAAISLPVGDGVRVRRLVESRYGELPIQALQVQYLVHTDHGLLTIAFTTPQAAETEDWEALFDALAATATFD
ncbi:MAG: hypothetical protein ACRDMX_09780, partial [Solirubrobacteraceae bacterium]